MDREPERVGYATMGSQEVGASYQWGTMDDELGLGQFVKGPVLAYDPSYLRK